LQGRIDSILHQFFPPDVAFFHRNSSFFHRAFPVDFLSLSIGSFQGYSFNFSLNQLSALLSENIISIESKAMLKRLQTD